MQKKNLLYNYVIPYTLSAILAVSMCGCFTGVEGTKTITQKDVNKAFENDDAFIADRSMDIYTVNIDTFPDWNKGKAFYVTDDNLKLLFSPSASDSYSESTLSHKILRYQGYITDKSIMGENTVNIVLTDSLNHRFVVPTNKSINEFKESGLLYTIPFLIDMDEVMQLRSMLIGKEMYVKTSLCYDANGKMMKSRKFVKVKITGIYPGDKVFPYMIRFIDGEREAYLYMSSPTSSIQSRTLSDLFSLNDVHERYPEISNENWERIVVGDVALDMTKDECRLSLGSPKSIERRPTYDGLKEYWTYDNGVYLIFEDGLLRKFRK